MHTLIPGKTVRFTSISISLLLLIFSLPVPAYSQIKYVSDYLLVNIRDNIEKPYTVIGTVKTDEQLKVLEEQGRYVKVETADGKQGWIKKQYLKTSLPKKIIIKNQEHRIEQLEKEIASLKELVPDTDSATPLLDNIKNLQEKLEQASSQNKKLTDTISSLTEENTTLKTSLEATEADQDVVSQLQKAQTHIQQLNLEIADLRANTSKSKLVDKELQNLKVQYTNLLQVSENAASIARQRDELLELKKKHQSLITEQQKTIEELESNTLIYWFLAGALVFLIGILFGKMSQKRRSKLMY